MKQIILIFILAVCFSCKKDQRDYAMVYVGVYSAKQVSWPGSFPLMIDKVDDNTISITTRWYGNEKTFEAEVKGITLQSIGKILHKHQLLEVAVLYTKARLF